MMHTKDIHTLADAQRHVEGIISDFEGGISTKEETVAHLFDYTIRVMEIAMEATHRKTRTVH